MLTIYNVCLQILEWNNIFIRELWQVWIWKLLCVSCVPLEARRKWWDASPVVFQLILTVLIRYEPIDRHCIFYIFFLKNLLPNLVTFVALLMDIIFLSIFFLYFRKTSPNLRIIGYAQDVLFVRLVAHLISRRIGKIHR